MSHLNSKVVGLNIQMSFSNDPGLPKYVGDVGPETDADSVMRSLECSGELVLGPTENVGLERLLENLSSVGFCLVDAFHQERVRRNVKPGQKSTYHMVRYHFVREDKAVLNDESREFVSGYVAPELGEILRTTAWRVRIFVNPVLTMKGGSQDRVVSINLEVRTPLVDSDGSPLLVWRRDEFKNKIGDVPLPKQPNWRMTMVEPGVFDLVPA